MRRLVATREDVQSLRSLFQAATREQRQRPSANAKPANPKPANGKRPQGVSPRPSNAGGVPNRALSAAKRAKLSDSTLAAPPSPDSKAEATADTAKAPTPVKPFAPRVEASVPAPTTAAAAEPKSLAVAVPEASGDAEREGKKKKRNKKRKHGNGEQAATEAAPESASEAVAAPVEVAA